MIHLLEVPTDFLVQPTEIRNFIQIDNLAWYISADEHSEELHQKLFTSNKIGPRLII
jgi:hypothetical protein